VQKNQEQANNLKGPAVPAKHKSTLDDEKDGPSRPKRVALGDITSAVRTMQVDSAKKSLPIAASKKEFNRLSPLEEQEKIAELEVDPEPDVDFDKENASDPYAVSDFACDIFRYYKHREVCPKITEFF
jgi:hypothetical protein